MELFFWAGGELENGGFAAAGGWLVLGREKTRVQVNDMGLHTATDEIKYEENELSKLICTL